MNLSDRAFGIGLVERAAKDGVAGWTARDRSTLIANAFFADRSRSERYKIELTFDDLIHQIAELIEKQDPLEMRETLGTVLSELKFVRDGFAPGKRPRRGRTVGPDTLTVLLGRLPASVVNKESPHGLGGGREEVPSAVPRSVRIRPDEPEVNLVNQGRALQGMIRSLGLQVIVSETP